VRQVVGDFAAMKGKAVELQGRLEQVNLSIDGDELDEIRDFMRWLADDHFTFLGYEEFSVQEQADGGRIVYDESSLLGLSRSMRTGLSEEEQSL
ncbi:NAD-glutamate dehydrogenase, partial [Klebsiella pneumoniae]|nr:NAD-glutamate dehydrogenase [Klebsiella pneumoniae]